MIKVELRCVSETGLGTACYVKGSQKILDRLKDRLQIEEGETTKDGKFSIEATRWDVYKRQVLLDSNENESIIYKISKWYW